MRKDVATWYGPGFYGNDTACGEQADPADRRRRPQDAALRLEGRAHATGGRFLRTKVVDRGPYTEGVRWDLTCAAAEKLRNDRDVATSARRSSGPEP